MFGCVLFGCVMFLFSEVGGLFWLDCFCLLILGVSDIVLLSCSLFIFWCISSISRSENKPFFIIVLTWSASLWLVWKLAHSCLISIILFRYPLCVGFLIKEQCSANWLSSIVHLLCLRLWLEWLLKLSFAYPKKEQPTFAGWRLCHQCWLLGEHPQMITPKPITWVPRCIIFWFNIFFMGGILWLYQTQELFIICTPDRDVTENSHGDCSWIAGIKISWFKVHQNILRKTKIYVFF